MKKQLVLFCVGMFLVMSFVSASPPCLDTQPCIKKASISKLFNFQLEQNIRAYECRVGGYTSDLPTSFDDCYYVNEITSHPGLDYDDESYAEQTSYAGASQHTIFKIENPGLRYPLKRFKVHYVSHLESGNPETHSLYIRNFNTGEWELLDDEELHQGEESLLTYTSNWGNKQKYLDTNGDMWFLTTDGRISFGSIDTDYFYVRNSYSILDIVKFDFKDVLSSLRI